MTILIDVRSSFFKVSEERDAECIPFLCFIKKMRVKVKIIVRKFAYIKIKYYLCNVIKKRT